jgi:hypothetical protein
MIFIIRIPVKVLHVFRVLMPKVMCILPQHVQLLVCLVLWLRARGNRDKNHLRVSEGDPEVIDLV